MANGNHRTLIEGGTAAAYAESGHLVYQRGTSILATPFDLEGLRVTGTPVAVVEGVRSLADGASTFTTGRTGTLVFWPGPHQRYKERLIIVDRAGQARGLSPFVESRLSEPRLSPDGRAVALRRFAANDQVWRFDIERASFSQATFEWDNLAPVWTPDGESLIVTSSPDFTLHRVRADGSGGAQPLAMPKGGWLFPGSVTADGLLAYHEGGKVSQNIWVVPLGGEGEPRALVQTPASEDYPALSPSGRLLAYRSDETGQGEIYLTSLPEGGSKIKVSTGGGTEPVWARSGRELFYRMTLEGAQMRMMRVEVSEGPPLRISPPRSLFEDSFARSFGRGDNTPSYDVFPDGQHFVMIEVDPEARPITHAKVVLNWFDELKRLVPSR